MELFEREDPNSIYYHEDLPDDAGKLGTPCHRDGQDFRTFMQKFDGFEPDADFYIYVVILKRVVDSSTWYSAESKGLLSGPLVDTFMS